MSEFPVITPDFDKVVLGQMLEEISEDRPDVADSFFNRLECTLMINDVLRGKTPPSVLHAMFRNALVTITL